MNASIKLRNLSPEPQIRVACAMIPQLLVEVLGLGLYGVTDNGWIWQLGAEVGDQRRLWIRADMAGDELVEVDLTMIKSITDDLSWMLPKPRPDWVLDKPQDAVLRLAVNGVEGVLDFDRVVEQGPMVTIMRFSQRAAGFLVVAYATIANGQDVFDVNGMIVWNDRKTQSVQFHGARLVNGMTQSVQFHGARLEIRHGEEHAPFLLASMGQQQPIVRRSPHVVMDGAPANWLSDAMAYPFFFTLIAEPDVTDADNVEFADLPAIRSANSQAAHGGPILALADRDVWDGLIGPHRATLGALVDMMTPSSRTFVDAWRDPWSVRPNANAKMSGQTGDQGIWNRCPMVHLFDDADPRHLVELWFSATDYFLRSHHFLDEQGNPLTFESGITDPKTTYGCAPFWRISGSAWGKNNGNNDPPWGWDHGQRGYLDSQHRGNKTPALALMMLGLPVLQDELDFLLASDIRDTRLRTPTSLEAPRAAGRLLQEWAWWWCGATPTQREHLQDLAVRVLTICEQQPSYRVPGPMKWLSVFSRTNSKNPLRNTTNANLGYECASPWEHSFVCDGASAWAAIYQRIGDKPKMTSFLDLAVKCATTVVDGALIEHETGVHVVTYAKVLPNGEANPAGYMVLPRTPQQQPDGSWIGAKTDLSGNCDMVFGGISLFWYSGAILTAAKAGNVKAQRLRDVLYSRAASQRDVEWLVGDQHA